MCDAQDLIGRLQRKAAFPRDCAVNNDEADTYSPSMSKGLRDLVHVIIDPTIKTGWYNFLL